MQREEILEKVTDVIMDHLNVDREDVLDEASFIDDLGADSLDLVELVMALEAEFNVSIPDQDVESIKTVSDAVTYIEANI
ncbi:MAG TPA: acyl carrier protein [Coriobacteriia bacterium]|nr:acyl carrier protein [Coriobacteriia bacterium]